MMQVRRTVESISENLERFFEEAHPTWNDPTITDVVDLTSGWETELFGFNLHYIERRLSVSRRLVARLYPGRRAAGKARHEYRVMGRLGEAGYPVPGVHEIVTEADVLGVPFMIMDWVEGHSMMDNFLGTPMEELGPHLEAFTNLFVGLHRVDPALVFPERHGIDDIHGYLDLAIERTRRDHLERGPPWLGPVLDWLEKRSHGVSPGRFSVLHRDFHPGNIMVRSDGSHSVIDWGASSLGDFREDLTWTVLLASAFWGRAFGDTILGAYRAASGEEIYDVDFFEVAAIYRRIQDTSISFVSGAEEAGMRAGAVEQMREGLGHLCNVHDFLEERTGIRITEFDELLRTVEG